VKRRSENQTATAFSLDRDLYEAMEKARQSLHMSRSNFIRMCLSKEITFMGMIHTENTSLLVAENRPPYDATTPKPRNADDKK
jgi:hypothetical protein